jgi:hypothetical protein
MARACSRKDCPTYEHRGAAEASFKIQCISIVVILGMLPTYEW